MLCRSTRMILLTLSTPSCNRCMSIAHRGVRTNKSKRFNWVIDSGASVHCTSDPSLLTSIYYKHPPVIIKVADNRTLRAQAVGTALLPLIDLHNKTHHVTLHNVIYHPNFHTNLLSVRRLWLDNHMMCRFDPHNYLQLAPNPPYKLNFSLVPLTGTFRFFALVPHTGTFSESPPVGVVDHCWAHLLTTVRRPH